MRKIKYGLLPLVTILAGCSSDDVATVGVGEGKINLNLNVDETIITATDNIASRATVVIPAVDSFKVELRKSDGSLVADWQPISDFPRDKSYAIGDYVIEAVYGDLNAEGVDSPCYSGATSFSVTEAATSNVDVTCSLANTMIAVTYTDAFKGYFSDYEANVISPIGNEFVCDGDEARPLYIHPGVVKLNISLTKFSGATATYQPVVIEDALARHFYKITLDVNNGEMGNAQLVVAFEDTLVSEPVVVDLSDEIMSCPAPEIIASGFENGQPIYIVEGTSPSERVRMMVNARGGLKSVSLKTQSTYLASLGFPEELDLMTVDSDVKALLTQLGLNVSGLWNNPDRMAVIDFTALLQRLIAIGGDETSSLFMLEVKDRYEKVSEKVKLVVNTLPKQ